MPKLKPVTPGELLLEEFLKPMGLSQYRLAKEIGVPAQRIGQIVAGKRAIRADTDLRLCRFFALSNGYWLRAQAAYDTEVAEADLSRTLVKIKPWKALRPELQANRQPEASPRLQRRQPQERGSPSRDSSSQRGSRQ
jgi:addiction module HigA family antidote